MFEKRVLKSYIKISPHIRLWLLNNLTDVEGTWNKEIWFYRRASKNTTD